MIFLIFLQSYYIPLFIFLFIIIIVYYFFDYLFKLDSIVVKYLYIYFIVLQNLFIFVQSHYSSPIVFYWLPALYSKDLIPYLMIPILIPYYSYSNFTKDFLKTKFLIFDLRFLYLISINCFVVFEKGYLISIISLKALTLNFSII